MRVTSIVVGKTDAVLGATDDDGTRWVITLKHYGLGGRYWWCGTIRYKLERGDDVIITSDYDEDRDEYFVRQGNYSIYSRDLQFAMVTETPLQAS